MTHGTRNAERGTRKPAFRVPASAFRVLWLLDESIAHWERLASGRALLSEGIFGEDCALCLRFRNPARPDYNHAIRCVGCPVQQRTGNQDCVGSPWPAVLAVTGFCGEVKQTAAFLKKAGVMVKFLKGLRKGNL